MKLNQAIVDILGCDLAPVDSDGVTHYILDTRDVGKVDLTSIYEWKNISLAYKIILDVWEEEQGVSFSCMDENGYLFNINTFTVDAIYTHLEEDDEDGDELTIAFQSQAFETKFVTLTFGKGLSLAVTPFHPLNDVPDEVVCRFQRIL